MFCLMTAPAAGSEQRRQDHVMLNGRWEFVIGQGDEQAYQPARARELEWKPVELPGQFMEWNAQAARSIKFVWARREFRVSQEQAKRLGVLHWNRICFGAAAWVNGRKVGQNAPTGPYQVLLPPDVLRPGVNTVVLKIPGAAGVIKSQQGRFLIPAGFANTNSRGMPCVTGDVWIDFADKAYMKWILAIPKPDEGKVTFRVTPVSHQPIDSLGVSVSVRPAGGGEVVGEGHGQAAARPYDDPLAGEHYYVDVRMENFRPWTHLDPYLYEAQVSLSKDGVLLDRATFTFGMRRIEVVDGNFKLNGKNLYLRGSNLLFEWTWPAIADKPRQYIVDEARQMNMNSFRTHTLPPSPQWADVADRYGTMILAEFPVLYNNANYHFTDAEYELWHRNCLIDAVGWMSRLWNHPAVIVWVLSNESHYDTAWETGPFHDFVRRMDPTRPTMRTGDQAGTAEIYDVHPIGNHSTWMQEGRFLRDIPRWLRHAKGRAMTNSEYMNGGPKPLQWTGTNDKLAGELAYAQLGAEHTEAMRRARFDGIWPFAYCGWTKTRTGREWKAGFAKPISAVWHSVFSDVYASLDLFDANYDTGQAVVTDLCLINDSWNDAKIHVDLLLTRECPQFVPEAECFDSPLARWSYDFELPADSIRKVPVTWRVPRREGNYWLTARTTGASRRAVLSQRFIHAVDPPVISPELKRRRFVCLGAEGDKYARFYFQDRGLTAVHQAEELRVGRDVVVIWDASKVSSAQRARWTRRLRDFAQQGGTVLVLGAESWDWKDLVDLDVRYIIPRRIPGASRAFAYPHVDHPMLKGIDPQWLKRWNGLPGTVAIGAIEGRALKGAKKILWSHDPQTTVVAEVPTASGTGRILFSQLNLVPRAHGGRQRYDPVAERIMINLLGL